MVASHRQLQPQQQKLPPIHLSWCFEMHTVFHLSTCHPQTLDGRSHTHFSPRVTRNSVHAQTMYTRPSFSPSRLKEKLGPGNEVKTLRVLSPSKGVLGGYLYSLSHPILAPFMKQSIHTLSLKHLSVQFITS